MTLLFVGLLALLLAGLAVFQYTSLRNSLISVRVASLRGDYSAARADFLRIPRLQSQAARRLLCAPTALAGADATARQLANTITVASGRTVTVVIYDNSLRPIIGGSSPRLDAGRLALARAGQETTPEVADSSAGTLLSVGFPIQIGAASPCGIAQLSVPMQPIDDVLVRERLVLAGGGVVALLLALAAGLMLTGRRAAEPTDRTVS